MAVPCLNGSLLAERSADCGHPKMKAQVPRLVYGVANHVFEDQLVAAARSELSRLRGYVAKDGGAVLLYRQFCVQFDENGLAVGITEAATWEGPRSDWPEVPEVLRKTIFAGIQLHSRQISELGEPLQSTTRMFKVIMARDRMSQLRVGMTRKKMDWHRDKAYVHHDEEKTYYADWTTVVMMSDPHAKRGAWRGGELVIQLNGAENGEVFQKDRRVSSIGYDYNRAITFENRVSIHSRTEMEKSTNGVCQRDVLIVEHYSDAVSQLWRERNPGHEVKSL